MSPLQRNEDRPHTRVTRRQEPPPPPPAPEPDDDYPELTDNPLNDVMNTLILLIERAKQQSREHTAQFEDMGQLLRDTAVLKDRVGIRDTAVNTPTPVPGQPGQPGPMNITLNTGGQPQQPQEKKEDSKTGLDKFISTQLLKWICLLILLLTILAYVAGKYNTGATVQQGNTTFTVGPNGQPIPAPAPAPKTTP